ncbi:hypothetical protein [Streptomyces sp. UH6]|uniref:DUF4097 family beta strand repeat-containing protein n=1 Tax=Streptomyces sp. UH6 TaxID=2748379 RepID=UPI0015D4EE8E|nr:hypothetical protein [Streptomyces sp. UH6]NYV78082.1 hypothetical protein [Streptomyces sp. UH6]
MPEWSVTEPLKLTLDEPVSALHVRLVRGAVNVVGTEETAARLEVSAVEGDPLEVTLEEGVLTVAYRDLPWQNFRKLLDRDSWRSSAVVTLAVPAGTAVRIGSVDAAAVVSGISGRTDVQGVNGDTTLVGLTGPVSASTVTGSVEAQALSGDIRFSSVGGDLTVVEGTSRSVRAESVTGSVMIDLGRTGPADLQLSNVSGEIAVRLPEPTDAEVHADTAAGSISNAFEDLRVGGMPGTRRVTGRLGAGSGRIRATTVSGSIALLRRPAAPDAGETDAPTEKVL